MLIEEAIYLQFPAILRNKLKNKEIEFPDDTLFDYTPVKAYRGVERRRQENFPVTREDFRSYAELGKKIARGNADTKNTPQYYGVSLYLTPEAVANIFHMPNRKWKIAEGYVVKEGGPHQLNAKTGHICWWLFENACLPNYTIIEWG